MTVMYAVLILKTSFLLLKKKNLDYFHYYLSVTSLRQTRANLVFNFSSLLAPVCTSRTCFEDVVSGNGGVSISQHSALLFPEKQNFLQAIRAFYRGFFLALICTSHVEKFSYSFSTTEKLMLF